MKHLLFATLWVAISSSVCLAQEPVREGNLERLMLDDGLETDVKTWSVAEGTVTPDAKHVKHGDTALHFHIDVNWETGEPKYPIGWPRMDKRCPAAQQDWTAYDYLEFSIFAESSRSTLPVTPLGLILSPREGKTNYNRNLGELKLGQWVDIRIPVNDLPMAAQCAGIKFYISESNYKHGDVLDFWIDNISLTRYTEPTVSASRLMESVVMSDVRYVSVDVAMMGVPPGDTAEVTWQLAASGKVAASGKFAAGRGKNTFRLSLPVAGLPPGNYELSLKCKGSGPPPFPARVVASPWKEETK